MRNFQTEQPSLQFEYSQLESEIQKLQLKLQIVTELHQEHIMKLCTKLIKEGIYCLEVKKKLPKVYQNISSVRPKYNSYRKLAKDLERELERNISFYQRWIMSHEKKPSTKLLGISVD